jgi:formylglycine-generating enzyme required for sulfatase activity
VTITGLGTLPAAVTVTGPELTAPYSVNQTLTATQTLSGLADGSYTVSAATVTDTTLPGLGLGNGGTLGPAHLQRYPSVLTQTATVSLGSTSPVTVNYPPATLTVTVNSTPIDLVLIPPGSFTMGTVESPVVLPTSNDTETLPAHTVTVGQAFYMAKVPCTQAQWLAVMGSNPAVFNVDDPLPSPVGNGLQRPVDSVTFAAITTASSGFMDTLNAAAATALNSSPLGGGTFRLPTEVEYEYACRAGSAGQNNYYFGSFDLSTPDQQTTIDTYAWFNDNNASTAYPLYPDPSNPLHGLYPPNPAGYMGGSTHQVGQKLPNAWGLYDMIGNIWEVCQDSWHSSYAGAPTTDTAWVDPPVAGNNQHVYRGGTWDGYNSYGQSRLRGPYPGTNIPDPGSNWDEGFRVVLQLP